MDLTPQKEGILGKKIAWGRVGWTKAKKGKMDAQKKKAGIIPRTWTSHTEMLALGWKVVAVRIRRITVAEIETLKRSF